MCLWHLCMHDFVTVFFIKRSNTTFSSVLWVDVIVDLNQVTIQ